jgi:hypothetical protein
MSYRTIVTALDVAYTRGGGPNSYFGAHYIAAGIGTDPQELLAAMVHDGVLRTWRDDSGRKAYRLEPPHTHNWRVEHLREPGDVIDICCNTCNISRTVPNRIPIEVSQ